MFKKVYLLFIFGIAIVALSGCATQATEQSALKNNDNNLMSVAKKPAEKIEVVHFHTTEQCWSCKTVGEFALKTIKEKFPEEFKNGTIVFKDINGELPENKTMVSKYQARGSSLFINAIVDGADNIEEDVTVWRLIADENQFIIYFQNKINKLLAR